MQFQSTRRYVCCILEYACLRNHLLKSPWLHVYCLFLLLFLSEIVFWSLPCPPSKVHTTHHDHAPLSSCAKQKSSTELSFISLPPKCFMHFIRDLQNYSQLQKHSTGAP